MEYRTLVNVSVTHSISFGAARMEEGRYQGWLNRRLVRRPNTGRAGLHNLQYTLGLAFAVELSVFIPLKMSIYAANQLAKAAIESIDQEDARDAIRYQKALAFVDCENGETVVTSDRSLACQDCSGAILVIPFWKTVIRVTDIFLLAVSPKPIPAKAA